MKNTKGNNARPTAVTLALLALAPGSLLAAGTGTRAQADWPLPVHDDVYYGQVFFDRLEYQVDDEESALLWDAQAWYGGDINRLWVETEGGAVLAHGNGGELEAFDVQYSRRIARFWDFQTSVGYQSTFGPGPDIDRGSVLVGFQGLAPLWFEIDSNLRLSEDGDLQTSLEGEYDWWLSQSVVLQGRGETTYAFDEVPAFGIGRGLTGLTLGLRLRYRIVPEFAPYVGVSWNRQFGDTADL